MAPSGIEPATFRFVAQHLNHCATAGLLPTSVLQSRSALTIFNDDLQHVYDKGDTPYCGLVLRGARENIIMYI